MIVAYVDADGVPHVSPRGTVQVWSPDQLAMWIRDPNGGLLRAIASNPHLSCFYRDAQEHALPTSSPDEPARSTIPTIVAACSGNHHASSRISTR